VQAEHGHRDLEREGALISLFAARCEHLVNASPIEVHDLEPPAIHDGAFARGWDAPKTR
jgi:hypothetical protein